MIGPIQSEVYLATIIDTADHGYQDTVLMSGTLHLITTAVSMC